jgi:hypothetical protein
MRRRRRRRRAAAAVLEEQCAQKQVAVGPIPLVAAERWRE